MITSMCFVIQKTTKEMTKSDLVNPLFLNTYKLKKNVSKFLFFSKLA